MSAIINFLRLHLNTRLGEKGASLVEYTLLLVLISVVVIVALTAVGTQMNITWTTIGSALGVAAGS